MPRLEGKVAVVTGAGTGIGAAVAKAMALAGATVVVVDIDETAAKEVVVEIAESGGRATSLQVDVTNETAVRSMITFTSENFGRLDILHNNAAATGAAVLGSDMDLLTLDIAVWDLTMNTNLRGPMLAIKHALPHMIGQGTGSIINTTSPAGELATAYFAAYGASKAGLNSLTRSVAARYGRAGVRCNAICPGAMVTETAEMHFPPEVFDKFLRHQASPRKGRPTDIANAAVFLASDESDFMTGRIMYVDGGVTSLLPHFYEDYQAITSGS